jgi:hypothetical protein
LKTVKHRLIACEANSVDDGFFLGAHEKCNYPKLPSAVDGGRFRHRRRCDAGLKSDIQYNERSEDAVKEWTTSIEVKISRRDQTV